VFLAGRHLSPILARDGWIGRRAARYPTFDGARPLQMSKTSEPVPRAQDLLPRACRAKAGKTTG
jgi:hypothetical protein